MTTLRSKSSTFIPKHDNLYILKSSPDDLYLVLSRDIVHRQFTSSLIYNLQSGRKIHTECVFVCIDTQNYIL